MKTLLYFFSKNMMLSILFILRVESGSQQPIAAFTKEVVEEVGIVIFYCIPWRTNGYRKIITCLM